VEGDKNIVLKRTLIILNMEDDPKIFHKLYLLGMLPFGKKWLMMK
jgi:hypothetical protein